MSLSLQATVVYTAAVMILQQMHVAINLEMLYKVCIITAFRSWYIAPALSSFLAVLRVRTSLQALLMELMKCIRVRK